MKVTALWIVKNEEKNLRLSLESVRDAVDEMVVIDTGSEDGTVALAESLGARVEHFDWVRDFAAARNFALTKATGGAVIFLDADEWFEPALGKKEHALISQVFEKTKSDAFQMQRFELSRENALIGVSLVVRVLRRHPDIRYIGKIHEQPRRNGKALNVYREFTWHLNHSGYRADLLQDKLLRNIDILVEVEKNAEDEQERILNQLYLAREFKNNSNPDDALVYLRKLMDNPPGLRRFLKDARDAGIPLIYDLFGLVSMSSLRNKFSRAEIKTKLFDPFEKEFPLYRGTPMLPLYYDSIFDLDEERLLQKLKPTLEAVERLPDEAGSDYKKAEAIIYASAARAAQRRGDWSAAMGYAVESIRSVEAAFSEECLDILSYCVRGQPVQEITLFFNSLYKTENPAVLQMIATGIIREGYQEVYLYYAHKLIESGRATQGDYLYMLIVAGKIPAAVEHAISLEEPENASVVAQNLFLAAVCSSDPSFFVQNVNRMAVYAKVLAAYFNRQPLDEVTINDINILVINYRLIAFAVGEATAELLRDVFKKYASPYFQVRVAWLLENGHPELVLKELPVGISPTDEHCFKYVARAAVAVGQDSYALSILKNLLEGGAVTVELIHLLRVLTGRDSVKREAEQLYGVYKPLLDRMIDLEDVVRTGYAVDPYTRKQIRALASTTPKQNEAHLAALAKEAATPRLLQCCAAVGPIFEQKEMYGLALDCYGLCVAKGFQPEENRAKMAEVFRKLGNEALGSAAK